MDGVVRFRERAHCTYLADGDVLKLFLPQSVRRIGGRSEDRVISGSIGFILQTDVPLKGRMSWVAQPNSLSMCPLANFPWIITHSALSGSNVLPEFVEGLHSILNALPRTMEEIERDLGSDFLSFTCLDRLPIMVRFLSEPQKA